MSASILDNTRERTLSNGLKVICCRKTSAPVVSAQVWYRTGSAHERDGIRGISHILEHMMFRGSKNIASEEHAQRINDVGGHCNAFTAEDVCAYLNCVPRNYLDMVFEMESDRMRGLALDPATLETERKVIIEEYHTYMNNPVAKAFLEFRRDFFDGHPYAVSPLGQLSDIQSVTQDDCRDYFRKHYHPENAVILVVGDFDSEEKVFEKAGKWFGDIDVPPDVPPAAVPPVPSSATGESRRGEWMKRIVEFDVPMLILGYPAPESAAQDALPLDILQMIISQGESSRLHREVVRRQSVAVMTGGMNHFLKLCGMSLFFAAFTPDINVRRVWKALEKEISTVRDRGITTSEMTKIRNTTLTHRALEMYSAEHICQRLGFSETVEGDHRLWIERMQALEKLDRDRVIEVARKYWDPRKSHALFLKPKRTKPLLFIMGLARRIVPRS
ncbi:MAG: hypothetical protein GF418_08395 [Chitinivibrionales bacterium]|nr:hypothetical protein [Chitinivibrionales bacterium]MBD3395632.1 hypothetical protein [Chitinivibrionales bacterium]